LAKYIYYVDGVAKTITSNFSPYPATTPTLAAPLRVGVQVLDSGSHYHKGYIAHILIYPEALSDARRQAIEAYLADYYGFP
jgi:hypothetical protein